MTNEASRPIRRRRAFNHIIDPVTPVTPEQRRREDIVMTVLRNKYLSISAIADKVLQRYGEVGEMVGGGTIMTDETTWYFKAPKKT